MVRRFRPHYDLIIETQSNVPLRWADAAYVHFPLVYNLKLHLEHQYRLCLYEKAYNSLVIWMARALSDDTKPVMTNSTWTAKYIRGHMVIRGYTLFTPRLMWRSSLQ